MIGISSPFIEDIPKCKTSMRKLRKKIYKYTVAQSKPRKVRDFTQEIFNILELREVPDFVIDSLKKKRTLDLSAIKNVVISNGSSFPQMASLVRDQELEVQQLFKQHKLRIKSSKRIPIKLEHRYTTYSSTEQSMKSQNQQKQISSQQKSIQEDSDENSVGDYYDYLALQSSLFSEEALFKF